MKITTSLRTLAAIAAMFAAVACSNDDFESNNITSAVGEEATVNLTFSVEGILPGDGLTKTVPLDINDDSPFIRGMYIIQFNGVSESSTMIGAPRYLDAEALAASSISVPLVTTSADAYTVFVANLTNYEWNLSNESTIKDVVKRVKTFRSEDDTYQTFDGDDKTLLMSAVTTDRVIENGTLSPHFTRNVAKVTLNLSLSNPAMEIKSVRLRNVPNTIIYADAALAETGVTASSVYPVDVTVMDYDAITSDLPVSDGGIKEFSWYVPRNQRGVNESSLGVKDKTFYAPATATYFEITAVKKDGGSVTHTSVFRVYPGANQTDDYNLSANRLYTVGLDVVDIGIDRVDSRVETFSTLVDYTGNDEGKRSNSFILNPAPAGGVSRTYRIPITQVNNYWGNSYAGYGNDPTKLIGENDQWKVALIWSDKDGLFGTDYTMQIGLRANNPGFSNGEGKGPDQCFEVVVPAGMPAGNFLLGIGKSTDYLDYLWSWHFWVTDYNPSNFNTNVIANGVYTYPVPGGQVERYADAAPGGRWAVDYQSNVMMDRNMGAVEDFFTANPAETNRGILHYQFGRKDPFPTSTLMGTGITTVSNQVPISASVSTPNVFYTTSSGNWTNSAGMDATNIQWNDPRADDDFKSIYDPCPPGWRLPVNGVWEDFNTKVDGSNITVFNSLRGLGFESGRGIGSAGAAVNGLRYWPGTSATDPVGGRIWYPAAGFRIYTTGGTTNFGSYGIYWSATPASESGGRSMLFTRNSITPGVNHTRAYGFSVRCISE